MQGDTGSQKQSGSPTPEPHTHDRSLACLGYPYILEDGARAEDTEVTMTSKGYEEAGQLGSV